MTKTLLTGALLLGALSLTTPAHAAGHGTAPAPPLTRQLSRFVGPWGAHGVALDLAIPTHRAEIVMRTYRWCGPGVSAPCDRLTPSSIIAGLDVFLRITAVQGDTALGFVVSSTDPRELPRGSYVGLTLLPYGRLYIDDANGVLNRTLCGPGSLSARPPAFPATGTCGA